MSEVARESAARVFARLLAGEVRLYHEEDVIAGRRRRDLAERLAGPIADAKKRYLERCSGLDPDARHLADALQAALDPAGAQLLS